MNSSSLYHKRKKTKELLTIAALYSISYFFVFLLLGIIGYVSVRGIGVLSVSFFTSVTSTWKGTVGIAGNLVNTLYIIGTALLIAVPVGVGAAIYLNEYAGQGKMVRIIEFATDVLAGIPSVIFGLFGMFFFGEAMGLGYSLLNGALTLALMVLPLILRNTQEALRTVPRSFRDGALGMGATKWHMIWSIILPSAMPGIMTGIVLATGRIAGESAALLFTAGSARKLSGGKLLGGKLLESGGTLAVELYLQMQNGEYQLAFGIGFVLILIVLLINLVLKLSARGLHHGGE